jgi:hypothetical protein
MFERIPEGHHHQSKMWDTGWIWQQILHSQRNTSNSVVKCQGSVPILTINCSILSYLLSYRNLLFESDRSF